MQDYGASITSTGRSDIHVGEPDVLIVDPEVQVTDGIGIFDFFQIDRNRPPVLRCTGRGCGLSLCDEWHHHRQQRENSAPGFGKSD